MPRKQSRRHSVSRGVEPVETGAEPTPASLLDWYDDNRRDLAWRSPPGVQADPYHVWLSEIMLQQTTVAAVDKYYRKFLDRWPTVEALAAADINAVLAAWAGLGYYARARNLHQCARVVAAEHGGHFPQTMAELKRLPGIGDYTAAAIAAIAFNKAEAPVDGNIERVMARLYCLDETGPKLKRAARDRLARLIPADRSGDFVQALMDLGAGVCTPTRPTCLICPWRKACRAHADGTQADFPRKAPKRAKPTRGGVCFWLESGGRYLFRRRPRSGLLGGMLEVPGTPWRADGLKAPEAAIDEAAPVTADWRRLPGTVRHSFTHFHLELVVAHARIDDSATVDGLWLSPAEIEDEAVPAVMKKVVRHALANRAA